MHTADAGSALESAGRPIQQQEQAGDNSPGFPPPLTSNVRASGQNLAKTRTQFTPAHRAATLYLLRGRGLCP